PVQEVDGRDCGSTSAIQNIVTTCYDLHRCNQQRILRLEPEALDEGARHGTGESQPNAITVVLITVTDKTIYFPVCITVCLQCGGKRFRHDSRVRITVRNKKRSATFIDRSRRPCRPLKPQLT